MSVRTAALSSTALASASYDDESQELEITFTSGRSYTFQSVPADIYEGLVASPSPGSYYNQNIKGIYG